MPNTYDLSRLDPATFQHLVNMLVIRVLGPGATGFGPGADGGRDGYFEGEAPYPSAIERWKGTWYIQAKFHALNASSNHNTWLIAQLKQELFKFTKPESRRKQPSNYILATNVDPTAVMDSGTFDTANRLVRESGLKFQDRFHIWGGQKILDLLALHPDIADYYFDLLSPGRALAAIRESVAEDHATFDDVLRHLVVTAFKDQQYLKLEQAGSAADSRPGIEALFVDLPFATSDLRATGMVEQILTQATAQNHRIKLSDLSYGDWKDWLKRPERSRIWFIKGGPGRGKSTLTQFLCQIHRAKIIQDNGLLVTQAINSTVLSVRCKAESLGLWPLEPRIPVSIELRSFAQWLAAVPAPNSKTIVAYLADTISQRLSMDVRVNTLLKAFAAGKWLFIFDGLDEVPSDVKELAAEAVTHFVDDVLVGQNADAFSVCTSRPQGYSGQFVSLGATNVDLVDLSPEQALDCAAPILQIDRSESDYLETLSILRDSIESPAVRAIMTTPLQAHIMAVVVRDGGKPPERKWQLFTNFYNVIRRREMSKTPGDPNLARLLREGDQLIKALHNRLGFELHAHAERSEGAQTSMNRERLGEIVRETVSMLLDQDVETTVKTLMDATLDRLVLVNTPESGDEVRFDIRPLQEFFAAEYLYDSTSSKVLQERLWIALPDSHWREVMHFLLSGIVENNRISELSVAVSILSQINERTEKSEARMINRRLALGSILTARLLEESVLEQDKRVRSQFRDSIMALLASTDAVQYLSGSLRSNSNAWLKSLTIQHLLEHSESEAIGAASIIAFEVADDDARLSRISEMFSNSSAGFKSALLEIISQRSIRAFLTDESPDHTKQPQKWFVSWCSSLLLKDDWHSLGRAGILSALNIIRNAEFPVGDVFAGLGIDPNLSSIFEQIFPDELNDKESSLLVITRRLGPYKAEYVKLDPSLTYLAWSEDEWRSLREAKGLFKLLYAIFDFAKKRTPEGLAAVKTELTCCPELLQSQSTLSRLLPTRLLQAEVAPEGATIDEYFENFAFRRLRGLEPLDQSNIEADWDDLITHDTSIAINLLLRPIVLSDRSRPFQTALSQGNKDALVSSLNLDPRPLYANAHRLPDLLSIDSRLRLILRLHSTNFLADEFHFLDDKFHAVKLTLPEEANFLPHLVDILAVATFVRHSNRSRLFRVQFFRGIKVPEVLHATIGDPSLLLTLKDKLEFAPTVRAACAALYLRHPQADAEERLACMSTLGDIAGCPNVWLLRAAAFALDLDVQSFDLTALRVVNKLMEDTFSDLKARLALEPILRSWREASWAAVSSARQAGSWT